MEEDRQKSSTDNLGFEVDFKNAKLKVGSYGKEALKVISIVILIFGVSSSFMRNSFDFKIGVFALIFCVMTYGILAVQIKSKKKNSIKAY